MNEQHGGRWVLDPGKLPASKTQFHTDNVTFLCLSFLICEMETVLLGLVRVQLQIT